MMRKHHIARTMKTVQVLLLPVAQDVCVQLCLSYLKSALVVSDIKLTDQKNYRMG